jgi:branched-chain amino acid transport system permease protein
MGISVNGTLLRLYVISGVVAGLGGALSAIATRVVGLDSLSFNLSANALVMLALGGVGNLAGAIAGTVIFVLFENQVSAISPFHWLILVGLLLVAVVLFAPSGLTGLATRLWRRRRGA